MNRHTRGRSQEVVYHSDASLFLLLTLNMWIWRYYGTQTLAVVKVHSSWRRVVCLKGVIYWGIGGWHSSHFGIVSETEEPV